MDKSKIQKSKYKQKFHSRNPGKKVLDVNLKGFLCSCNSREKDCVKESYNLLNKYADILYPPQSHSEDSKEDIDIADSLKNELLELNSNKDKRRFQVVESGAKNIIFIKTTLENPVQLAEKIVLDIADTKIKQAKILLRLVPIEVTCRAYVNDIQNAVKQVGLKYFEERPRTFSIVYNHRNNNNLERDEVIKGVADVIFEIRSDHKVNLKDAEISIVIEIIKGIALIGMVPNFIKYKKYNLHAICKPEVQNQNPQEQPLEANDA